MALAPTETTAQGTAVSGFQATAAQQWKNLSTKIRSRVNSGRQMAIIIAVLASLVATSIVLILWSTTGGYRPLYGAQERFDAAQILGILDEEKIDYRLQESSGQILVQEDNIARARMLLAAKGVQAKLPEGLEMLGKDVSLGTSQFVETARYRRGLEGELARTIMALNTVQFARVHLAIPERTLLLRGSESSPTASIMVELKPGASLEPEHVKGIVNLIKGSVTNLEEENISIVDQSGNLLTAGLTDDLNGTNKTVRQLEYQRMVEQSYQRRVADLLQPVLGRNNFRVQVVANLDFNAVEETKESIDPNAVVREEMLQSDLNGSKAMMGIPGALSNRPPVTNANNNPNAPATATTGTEDTGTATDSRSEQQRRYEIGRTVRHTKFEQGALQKLSVSIVLNKAVAPDNGWSEADLANISKMAKDAVSFSELRGDQFSLNAFDFSPVAMAELRATGEWWEDPLMMAYARYLVGAILGLSLIFFVLRRLVLHLTGGLVKKPKRGKGAADAAPIIGADGKPLVNADGTPLTAQTLQMEIDSEAPVILEAQQAVLDQLPDTNSPLVDKLSHLRILASNDHKKVAEVIEQWLEYRG